MSTTTADVGAEPAAAARPASTPWEGAAPYLLLGLLAAALAGGKALANELDVPSWIRQVVLLAVAVAGAVFVFLRPAAATAPAAATGLHRPAPRLIGLVPMHPVAEPGLRARVLRLAVGVAACTAAVAAVTAEDDGLRLGLAAAAGLLAVVLVAWEVRRYYRWRWPARTPGRTTAAEGGTPVPPPAPRRVVLWSTMPLVVSATATALVLLVDDRPSALAGPELAELVAVTAFGEELLFRGLFLVIAYRVVRRHPGELVTAGAFALWHVPDAIVDGAGEGIGIQIAVVGGTMLAMFAAGLVLSWFRHRTGSLLAPTLLHVAANLPGLALA